MSQLNAIVELLLRSIDSCVSDIVFCSDFCPGPQSMVRVVTFKAIPHLYCPEKVPKTVYKHQ